MKISLSRKRNVEKKQPPSEKKRKGPEKTKGATTTTLIHRALTVTHPPVVWETFLAETTRLHPGFVLMPNSLKMAKIFHTLFGLPAGKTHCRITTPQNDLLYGEYAQLVLSDHGPYMEFSGPPVAKHFLRRTGGFYNDYRVGKVASPSTTRLNRWPETRTRPAMDTSASRTIVTAVTPPTALANGTSTPSNFASNGGHAGLTDPT